MSLATEEDGNVLVDIENRTPKNGLIFVPFLSGSNFGSGSGVWSGLDLGSELG